MKNFKSFIAEDEKLTPEYIKKVLIKDYGFKHVGLNHAYTLENNSIITHENITIDNNKNKKLPILIQRCKHFTISHSNITSTYGFPKDSDRIYMRECDDIIIVDFANTSQDTLQIENCSSIKIIKNINSSNLNYIYIDSLVALEILNITQCSTDAAVIIGCWNIKLSNIKIGNKISMLNFYNCVNFQSFSGCTIAAESGRFDCKYLKTFDGFDTLHIDDFILDNVDSEAKNVSHIITSPNSISVLNFRSDIPHAYYMKTKKMRDAVFRYVFKNNKAEYIMDFTLEMIDGGFEDQL